MDKFADIWSLTSFDKLKSEITESTHYYDATQGVGNIRLAGRIRPARSYRNINRSSEDMKIFFLLFTDSFGGKQIICGREDLFFALRRYPSNNPAGALASLYILGG